MAPMRDEGKIDRLTYLSLVEYLGANKVNSEDAHSWKEKRAGTIVPCIGVTVRFLWSFTASKILSDLSLRIYQSMVSFVRIVYLYRLPVILTQRQYKPATRCKTDTNIRQTANIVTIPYKRARKRKGCGWDIYGLTNF